MANITNLNQYNGVFDDGTREVTLSNPFGKVIAKVHFRPADYSILERIYALREDFSGIVAPLKDISINADGTASFEKDWAIVKGVEAKIIDRLNQLFDMDDCAEIFKNRFAFASINGKFYAEAVFETLGNIVVEAVEAEMEKSKARTEEYTKDLTDDAGSATDKS